MNFTITLKFLALPNLSEATHCRVNKSMIPADKTDKGIHKYGWSKKKPVSKMRSEIIIAKLIFIGTTIVVVWYVW